MTEPFDAPDEKYAPERRWTVPGEGPCFSPGGGLTHRMNCTGQGCDCRATAAREQSMRETADPQSREVVVRKSRWLPAIEVLGLCDGPGLIGTFIPVEQLPRVVRELAALMNERDLERFEEEIATRQNLRFERVLIARAYFEKLLDLAKRNEFERGPGISALPVKSEALSFTLEDLLCEDA